MAFTSLNVGQQPSAAFALLLAHLMACVGFAFYKVKQANQTLKLMVHAVHKNTALIHHMSESAHIVRGVIRDQTLLIDAAAIRDSQNKKSSSQASR
ncbi:hypothetical protein WG899_12815 [Paucibacter sp. AS339]|uniref:hypothetical protein n=1 Tax=Paucibacter hankyongi TaxID=3133434 RepID=UPI0030A1A867